MQLRTEIEINATPEEVWRVLIDTESYPTWNPFIVEVADSFNLKQTTKLTISPPASSEMNFSAQVTQLREAQELRWVSSLFLPFFFRAETFFEFRSITPEVTRIVQGQNLSGILLKFFHRQITEIARGFIFMNQALKRRVEEAHRRNQ